MCKLACSASLFSIETKMRTWKEPRRCVCVCVRGGVCVCRGIIDIIVHWVVLPCLNAQWYNLLRYDNRRYYGTIIGAGNHSPSHILTDPPTILTHLLIPLSSSRLLTHLTTVLLTLTRYHVLSHSPSFKQPCSYLCTGSSSGTPPIQSNHASTILSPYCA